LLTFSFFCFFFFFDALPALLYASAAASFEMPAIFAAAAIYVSFMMIRAADATSFADS